MMIERSFQLFCSKQRKKLPFHAINPGKIKLYVCGVTTYDLCHLGHARTYTVFDLWSRLWRLLGFEVEYVRNITDIDDKIIEQSKKQQTDWQTVATQMTAAMQQDFDALGLLRPTYQPLATDYIDQMIAMIQKLIENQHAYQVGDHVYFSAASFAQYGSISGQQLDKLQAGERVSVVLEKRAPGDFVLWKPALVGEPAWQSPWGPGRPGWHSECAAMANSLLGNDFDIHGGGFDLKFPHHDNEQAQACSAFGGNFARYWLHVGFLEIDQCKMSKSLGNFIRIRDALTLHPASVWRLFFLMRHYRAPLDYTQSMLGQANHLLKKIYRAGHHESDIPLIKSDHSKQILSEDELFSAFRDALCDDLNTPLALSVLSEACKRAQVETDQLNKEHAAMVVREMAELLALSPDDLAIPKTIDQALEQKIISLIEQRNLARKAGDFDRADHIRKLLQQQKIKLEDSPDGTKWWYDAEIDH